MNTLSESGQAGADNQRTEVVITSAMLEAALAEFRDQTDGYPIGEFALSEIRQIMPAALFAALSAHR